MLARVRGRIPLVCRYLSTASTDLSPRSHSVVSHDTPFPVKKTPASVKPPQVFRSAASLSQAEKDEIITKRRAEPAVHTVTALARQFNLRKTAIMDLVSAPPSRHEELKEAWEKKHRKADINAWAEKCRQIEKDRAAAIKAANKEWYATLYERKRKNMDPRIIFAPDYKLPKDEVRRRDKL